jgi:hypothetical protein
MKGLHGSTAVRNRLGLHAGLISGRTRPTPLAVAGLRHRRRSQRRDAAPEPQGAPPAPAADWAQRQQQQPAAASGGDGAALDALDPAACVYVRGPLPPGRAVRNPRGSVVVLGDAPEGTLLEAAGDVLVMGRLAGEARAGAGDGAGAGGPGGAAAGAAVVALAFAPGAAVSVCGVRAGTVSGRCSGRPAGEAPP